MAERLGRPLGIRREVGSIRLEAARGEQELAQMAAKRK